MSCKKTQHTKQFKLDFGRDNPILYLPCLPTKCGYMNCQGCAAQQFPKEPFTVHISALTLLGRERQDNLPVPVDFLWRAIF